MYSDSYEHPDITAAHETGYPKPVRWPRCPVCKSTCDTLFRKGGVTIGCNNCYDDDIEKVDAWEDPEAMGDEWF